MNELKLGVKGVKDILSREELKKIIGGTGSGSGSGSGRQCNCTTSADCTGTEMCMAFCDDSYGKNGYCA